MTALKPKTQLVRLSDLQGKTIAPDGLKESDGDLLCFRFTDGSFAIFRGYGEHDYDRIKIISETLENYGFYPYQLQAMGLIDQAEYDRLTNEMERLQNEEFERREREQLKTLLKKYGLAGLQD